MNNQHIEQSSTTVGLPISPALGPVLQDSQVKRHRQIIDRRTLMIALISTGIAIASVLIARILVSLITFITNISFFGNFSTQAIAPAQNHLGYWVILIPVIGGFIVGLMARYGSKAIRGHGIPEAMEQILLNESRIPRRLTFLKPLSAALAIGTGGPFGAEGPIIATGGAIGSWVGQIVHVTSDERKVLLAAGAAAGMTAIFGTPIAAILLAIELLLFEFKPRSFIPVMLASITAMSLRPFFFDAAPMFIMPELPLLLPQTLLFFFVEGILMGGFAVLITKSVYFVEDLFEKLPLHWMWWPMIGGFFVGVIGFLSPKTMGVGYDNIEVILSGNFIGVAALSFCLLKFLSWSIALGSGTSGGTLAPIFTIGGGFGVLLGSLSMRLGITTISDLPVIALVGMASCFAGSSRAIFTSVVFAFEATRQPTSIVPLLIGCSMSYVISVLLMQNTIMSEKLARRGHHVPVEYSASH